MGCGFRSLNLNSILSWVHVVNLKMTRLDPRGTWHAKPPEPLRSAAESSAKCRRHRLVANVIGSDWANPSTKPFLTSPSRCWDRQLIWAATVHCKAQPHSGVPFRFVQSPIRVLPEALDPKLSSRDTERISKHSDIKSNFHKLVFDVDIVLTTEFGVSDPVSNLNCPIRAVELLGVISELMHWIYFLGFYFCNRHIHTKGDPKQVENDMYDDVLTFF